MPICPNCKETINYLYAYSEVVNTFELDKNGEPFCFGQDNIEGYTGFECPECHEKIFLEENDAIEFLKDKDELQEIMIEKLNKIKEKESGNLSKM